MCDQGPIFVVGTTRSGKTLISVLLSSHPNIAISQSSPNMWTHFYGRYGDLSQRANFERCITAMLSHNGPHKGVRALNPNPDRIRKEFWQGEPTYGRLFALFQEHYAEQMGKPRWGDQTPRMERHVDAILSAYPTVKMIHMIRDPRDRHACRCVRQLRLGDRRSLRELGQVGVNTANWLYSVHLAQRNQKQYPDRYKIIRYETLVSQPEKTLREVCTFLGEAYVPAMMEGVQVQGLRDESGNRNYDGISTAYIGCFHQVMSGREIAFMQAQAKQAMAVHDYDLEPIQLSLSDHILLYVIDWPVNLVRMSISRTLESVRIRFPVAWKYISHLLGKV